MNTPYEPMTQWESILDALPRVLVVVALVGLWVAAKAWRRWQVRRRESTERAWLASHERGGDPRP